MQVTDGQRLRRSLAAVVLGNPDETRLVAEAFADLASGCDKPDTRGGMETTTEVVASPFRPPFATI